MPSKHAAHTRPHVASRRRYARALGVLSAVLVLGLLAGVTYFVADRSNDEVTAELSSQRSAARQDPAAAKVLTTSHAERRAWGRRVGPHLRHKHFGKHRHHGRHVHHGKHVHYGRHWHHGNHWHHGPNWKNWHHGNHLTKGHPAPAPTVPATPTPTPTPTGTPTPTPTPTPTQPPVTPGLPRSEGAYVERERSVLKQAVVLIQNGTTDQARKNLADAQMWRTQYFGKVAAWFTNVSGGRYTYAPAGQGVYVVPADAAVTAKSSAKQCAAGETKALAEKFLTGAGIADTVDSTIGVFDTTGCGWGGMATVGGSNSGRGYFWSVSGLNIHADVHELGHNLGFPHAKSTLCAGGNIAGCTDQGDGYGATQMGGFGAESGFSAVERLWAGFLNQADYLATAGNGSVSLIPAYAPEAQRGVRALEVKANSTHHYVAELRQPTARIDSAFADIAGVRIYRVPVTAGKPEYRNGQLIRLSSTDDRGLLPSGTVIRDGNVRITVGSGGRVSVSGL